MRSASPPSLTPPWNDWDAHPEVRRLLLLTLVLLSLWFSDVRGPVSGDEGPRRLGNPRHLAPGTLGWVDDLLPQPVRARRHPGSRRSPEPMRARRR